MAVTRIFELPALSEVTADDLFIVNDGSATTNKITYGNLYAQLGGDLQAADLTFAGNVSLNAVTTINGVLSVTANTTFTGTVAGIAIGELDDVNLSVAPLDGQNLVWIGAQNSWAARTTIIPPNTVVDSINGQIGTVVLTTDDIDDSTSAHKFVTSAQRGLIDTSLQPNSPISELVNDEAYVSLGDNISGLTNDAGYLTSFTAPVDEVNGQTGSVLLDADDIDDTSTAHKFATAVQLSLAETAVQPTQSINVLADVDTSQIGGPDEGSILRWDGTNWVPSTGSTTEWEATANGTSAYNFAGPGLVGDEDNPDLYVVRGQTYRFKIPAGTHPFAIQSDTGTTGTLYNDGVTDNEETDGTVVLEVRMDAPDILYYQCRNHGSMVGTIRVLNASNTLNNIADNAQGVVVTGKVACGDLDVDFGGGINAAGTSIDFQNSTISFSGASIGGLQGEISDGVDFHLNQSTATDGQLLAWDASANGGNGDYEWVDPTAQSTSLASTFTWDASMIPDTNAQYDLGSAEYKVRHLFLSDNSIKFESGDLGVAAGNLSWQGEPILPTTIANLLTVLGVDSHPDNGAALGAGLVPGDVYYDTTESKLKAVTA